MSPIGIGVGIGYGRAILGIRRGLCAGRDGLPLPGETRQGQQKEGQQAKKRRQREAATAGSDGNMAGLLVAQGAVCTSPLEVLAVVALAIV